MKFAEIKRVTERSEQSASPAASHRETQHDHRYR